MSLNKIDIVTVLCVILFCFSGEVHGVQHINAYNRPARDSDIDSDSEETENEADDATPPLQNELPWRRQQQEDDMATKGGWNTWCSVL